MNFVTKSLAIAALSVSVVSAELRATTRQLQTTDQLCTACNLCDAISCNVQNVIDVACDNCALFNIDGLCDACNACDSIDACSAVDADDIKDIGCGFCPAVTDPDLPGTCFSEIATVQLPGGTTTSMKDLKIGDNVLTEDGSYQPVYAFGHHHPTKEASFFQISTEEQEQALEVTADHLIFLHGKSSPVAAQTIQVGDVLRVANAAAGSTVTKIDTVERKGIYAPLTTGGTVVVDGVVASSYITLNTDGKVMSDHDLIHQALSPFRLLCNGVSATFCDTRYHHENGMPLYAHYGLQVLQWVMNSNAVVQALSMSTILFLTGACQVLENLFGASLAPLLVFLAAVGYSQQRNGNKTSKTKTV